MLIGNRIDDCVPTVGRNQFFQLGTNGLGTLFDDIERYQNDFAFALALQHAHQRRISHRVQRMMAHA